MNPKKLSERTLQLIKEVFSYDPATGVITRQSKTANCCKIGEVVGTVGKSGYRRVKIAGQRVMAHRIAWYLTYGLDPSRFIDHINGNPDDNRIENLREATSELNSQNKRRALSLNRTGLLGVTRRGSRFHARIRHRGVLTFIGIYRTPEEAHEAYLRVKRVVHEGCTI